MNNNFPTVDVGNPWLRCLPEFARVEADLLLLANRKSNDASEPNGSPTLCGAIT